MLSAETPLQLAAIGTITGFVSRFPACCRSATTDISEAVRRARVLRSAVTETLTGSGLSSCITILLSLSTYALLITSTFSPGIMIVLVLIGLSTLTTKSHTRIPTRMDMIFNGIFAVSFLLLFMFRPPLQQMA